MRLMLNGKLPTKEELMGDELVAQMITESKEQGKTDALKDAPTKEKVIQSLTVEDAATLPEPVRLKLTEGVVTKESVLQSLTVEDVPEAVKQKIVEVSGKVDPKVETFLDQVVQAAKVNTGGRTTTNDDEKKSDGRKAYEKLGSR